MEMAVVGKVVRSRGVRGEVVVAPASRDPEKLIQLKEVFLERVGTDPQKIVIQKVRVHSGKLLIKLEGIEDREAAEFLKGLSILVPRSELPELESDEFYIHDVIGLTVEDREGKFLGRIIDVYEMPANDVYVMECDEEEVWIPAVKNVVLQVDIARKKMVVELPDGLPVYKKEEG